MNSIKAPWLLAACLAGMPSLAPAQETKSAATVTVNIERQPMEAALNSFATQTGLQLLFRVEEVIRPGLTSQRVVGTLTPEAALKQMLEESGLRFEFINARTVAIRTLEGADGESKPTAGGLSYTDRMRLAQAISVTQESGRSELSTASEPTDSQLMDVVVTATKTDTPLIEAPQSISVVTREEMALRGVQDLNQALSYSTGIKFRDYPGGSGIQEFFLRGFRANVSGESVYKDGLRQQYASLTGNVEPYGLEKIELLKGPASVLYGQGNPGGLVNLSTKRPQSTPVREVQLQLGDYDRKQAALDFGSPMDEEGRFLYRVTGLVRDAGLQYQYGYDDRLYVAPAFSWKPGAETTLTLLGEYLETTTSGSEQSYPAIGTIFPNPNGQISHKRFLGDPAWNRINVKYRAFGYLFNTHLSDRVTLNQVARYTDTSALFHNISDRSLGLLVDDRLENRGANDRSQTERQLSADTSLAVKGDTGPVAHKFLAGFDYARVRPTLSQRNGTPAAFLDLYDPVYDMPINWNATLSRSSRDGLNQAGIYLQDQMRWDHLVLTLNGRHDSVRSFSENLLAGGTARQTDKKATGRIGLLYEFDSGFAPYASYSTSFQPSAQSTFDGRLFKPTEGEQIEGGLKYQPRGSSRSIVATVYRLTQSNVATPDIDHPGFATQQGEVRSDGFELEARTPVGRALNLIFAYAYTDARVTKANPDSTGISAEGRRQQGVPRNTASGWLDYTLSGALEGLNVGAGLRYVGSSYNVPNTIAFPDYFLADLGVHYSHGPYKVSVNITNLFNKDYFNPGFYPNSVYYGYKRTTLATVTRSW